MPFSSDAVNHNLSDSALDHPDAESTAEHRIEAASAQAPAPQVQRRRRSHARSRSELRDIIRHPAFLVASATVFIAFVWFGFQLYSAAVAYREISADARDLQQYENRELATLTVEDLRSMQTHFDSMDTNFRRLDRATSLPIVGRVVEVLPWVGPRYEAGRNLVEVGVLLSSAGQDGSRTGADVMIAFEQSGLSQLQGGSPGPTWLDVVTRDHDTLLTVADQIEEARALRASTDVGLLPARIRAKVDALDRVLNRYELEHLAQQTLPAVEAAFGANGPVSYWILFPNPAELRPAGGFPGTGASVTFDHGQIVSYDFYNMKEFSNEYIAKRSEVIPAPVAIDTYLYDGGFLPHDTVWWSDFPRLGEDFMRMYAELDRPAISGVIALQPTAVADLLRVIGSVTVDVDGQPREITPENVFLEMELQRARRRAGEATEASHKDVIALVGNEIVTQLKSAGRQQLWQAAQFVRDGADRRDIQVYSTDEDVQRVLDQRAWSGRANPDPEIPTLSITFANVVATKASLTMFPEAVLKLGETSGGMVDATLDITLKHEGTNEVDPYYAGFQRWWVQVDLPDGSTNISGNPAAQADPDAPDGGAYLIEIFPQQTGTISVEFAMPEEQALLFRRQPGVNTVQFSIDREGCAVLEPTDVGRDVVVDLTQACN